MQTVFRVKVPEQPGHDTKTYQPRRAHRKSRTGCKACKQRRVKCDEGKPCCGRCIKSNSKCTYSHGTFIHSTQLNFMRGHTHKVPPPSTKMNSLSMKLVVQSVDDLLNPSTVCRATQAAPSDALLLRHFLVFTSLTLGSESVCKAMCTSIAAQGWENPHLMHMALALSSAHLKRLHSLTSQTQLRQQYCIVEATHWESGLQLYQKVLQAQQHNADALIATMIMTVFFTFALEDDAAENVCTISSNEGFHNAIMPLAATRGFRALSDLLGSSMLDSIWMNILDSADDAQGTFSGAIQSIDDLPAAFVDLCKIDNESAATNEYTPILQVLTPLLRLKPHVDNFTKLIAFCGRTWPDVQPLLLRKDSRCLLLIAYWFALLLQMDLWWITTRAKRECTAIVDYLSSLQQPKITALLPFPASLGRADLSYIWQACLSPILQESDHGWRRKSKSDSSRDAKANTKNA